MGEQISWWENTWPGEASRWSGGRNSARDKFPKETRMILETIFENVPMELRARPQWVLWREEPRKDDPKKMTKPPYQPNGLHAKSNDPATWSLFDAVKTVADRFDGPGFVLSPDDDIIGIDLDHCRCPAFDKIDPEISGDLNMVLPVVADRVGKLNSYSEVSPSGYGIRIFVRGKLPVDRKKNGDYEIYQSNHYLTVTGHILDGFPRTVEPRQTEVDAFYQEVFGAPEKPLQQESRPRLDILLIGPGANGKSVLLEVIRLLVGPGQVAAVQPEQMDNRFQRAHLFGKLANIVTEIKEGGEIAGAALKAITSGELTTAEHKFKKPFDFQPFSTCGSEQTTCRTQGIFRTPYSGAL
jgi:hypothetical protein